MFLCSNICSRFNELEVGAFEMTYLVPDHPPCVLETDLDVRVMYLSLMNEKKYTVTIAIKEFLFPEKQNRFDDVFCGDDHSRLLVDVECSGIECFSCSLILFTIGLMKGMCLRTQILNDIIGFGGI
ncbi:hypothetical protein L3X38_037621 [Prunus dulcis]|uniref:Uncharacterized protein n=1 Tax=Prunus dulcis TaxID=3755 RepID=A0AAD4V504_PRUDU|nr:hypothetical protein L3X38_037621 [Prunus dulcis]